MTVHHVDHISGVKIIFSDDAIGPTDERLFPESRHRSARIKKKLIKRFGGEFVMGPCIWRTAFGVFAHTSFRGQIQNAFTNHQKG